MKAIDGSIIEFREINNGLYMHLCQKRDISEIQAYIASSLDWISIDNYEDYLHPRIKNLLPDPFHLLDMDLAVSRIIDAMNNGNRVMLFADYDVDGACSAAILKLFLVHLGIDVGIYIPDRFSEGYGPNKEAFLQIKNDGYDLVITLDCGTVAFDPMIYAKEIGLDAIVIDHHIGAERSPESIAFINPNRYNELSPYKYLSAGGVTFLLCVAVQQYMKRNNMFGNKEPYDLLSLIDLVALSTVCDVMKLEGLNRAFVSTGLKLMQSSPRNAIKAMMNVTNLSEIASVYHLGFIIGPMINAGGRMDDSSTGSRLLSCDDYDTCLQLAEKLMEANQERKEVEKKNLEFVGELVPENHNGFIFASDESLHQGVIGILASRIKDKHNAVTFIGSHIEENGESIIKVSCRSISGFDVGECVMSCLENGLLIKGGGHGAAAGFSCYYDMKESIIDFIYEKYGSQILELSKNRHIKVLKEISIDVINIDFVKSILVLEPFGISNPSPIFVINDIVFSGYKIMKDVHMAIFVKSKYTGVSYKITAFNIVGNSIGDCIMKLKYGSEFHCVASLGINSYMGKENIDIILQNLIDNTCI